MSTIEKGNKLEDAFFEYLCEQKDKGFLVYDVYPPELCKIYKKKDYYCKEREGYVNFDVVIELFRKGRSDPHLYVIFECKNHGSPIQERDITDASDKITRIFKHAAKGVVVGSIGLQRGAENVARSRKMGIVKYDETGLEVVADRKGHTWTGKKHLESQIFGASRSLKVSGYYDGKFYGSIEQILASVDPDLDTDLEAATPMEKQPVPFLSDPDIQKITENLLEQVGYQSGQVDLHNICSMLSINLTSTEQTVLDPNGNNVLGSANFDRKSIQINFHENKKRERFTLAHEIGHFHLGHDQYLRSETVAEHDLIINKAEKISFNYERLEYQANMFASELLLPGEQLLDLIDEWRRNLGIKDKGHGYIFVDDQPCNYLPYTQIISELSSHFAVSKQAIEIRLARMGLVNDVRHRPTNIFSHSKKIF